MLVRFELMEAIIILELLIPSARQLRLVRRLRIF